MSGGLLQWPRATSADFFGKFFKLLSFRVVHVVLLALEDARNARLRNAALSRYAPLRPSSIDEFFDVRDYHP